MKQPITKLVPMALIDEPEIAMRSSMDDGYLQELAASIQRDGLLNPLSVTAKGERYTIEAGHCRFVACKMIGLEEVEVRDYLNTGVSGEAIKCAENLFREDVNDADMAEYLYDLQENKGFTLEQFIAITRKSEQWIASRLNLYRGDQRVFDALRQGTITLKQATLLNRFPDDFRLMYIGIVIEQTPPVRIIEQWLREVKGIQITPVAVEGVAGEPAPAAPLPGMSMDVCRLCDSTHAPWDMEFVKLHKQCLSDILKAIAAAGAQ